MNKNKIKYPIGGFAPGLYYKKCESCGNKFMGDKYASQCKPCAINTVNESNINALKELYILKTAIKNIDLNHNNINKILNKTNDVNMKNEQTIHNINTLIKFCKNINQQENCPPEFQKIVNKEFWNLI